MSPSPLPPDSLITRELFPAGTSIANNFVADLDKLIPVAVTALFKIVTLPLAATVTFRSSLVLKTESDTVMRNT